jgi:EmrB/QacA subfamily drug resistance transporter
VRATTTETQLADDRAANRWVVLAILAAAQFMVVLDLTIVNVALPSIGRSLGFSTNGLQWVLNAYTLAFGGLLMLGGRAADTLGRRKVFVVGLALFAGASLAGGLAHSQSTLISARAIQGIGAALLSPAALAIVTRVFPAGRDRNTALGVWGALAGVGGTLGVVAGGLLVKGIGWQWVFFVNVPIGVLAIPLAMRLVPDSRAPARARAFDAPGALTGTAGLLLLVYAVIGSDHRGWGATATIAMLAGAGLLLLAFVAIEYRSSAPLIPLGLFRSRAISAANLAIAFNGAAFVAMFFLTALSMQDVLGYSALTTGLAFVPMGLVAILSATTGPQFVTRFGVRPVFLVGAVTSVVGLWLLSSVHVGGHYVANVLPGMLVFGIGLPLCGVPNTILAVADADDTDAGVASGLINAGQQIGGAIGLAVMVAIATADTTHLARHGTGATVALADGYSRGFIVAAAFAAINVVIALTLTPRLKPLAESQGPVKPELISTSRDLDFEEG